MKKKSNDNLREVLAQNIKFVREDVFGYTQVEFASKIGMSQGFVSDMEKEKKVPGGEFFMALHRFYVNTNFLMTGQGPVFASIPKNRGKTIGERIQLVRLENGKNEIELSDILGIPLRDVIYIERGFAPPPEKNVLVFFSHVFNIDCAWLEYGGEKEIQEGWKEGLNNEIVLEIESRVRDLKIEIKALREHLESVKKQEKSKRQIVETQNKTIKIQEDIISSKDDLIQELRKNP